MSGRLRDGGRIDRQRPVRFRFDGRTVEGFDGDTVASALLAAGRRIVGRSVKYHRPRGIVAADESEPNALLRIGTGARAEPNIRATTTAVSDGLSTYSQNAWPGLHADAGAALGLVSRFLGAGFYYKTFLWPRRGWKVYERLIRRAAGLGRPPEGADPRRHESRHDHCDVLVVGAGPAGLAATAAAARAGARVMLCDQDRIPGGRALGPGAGGEWCAATAARLAASANVRMLYATTAIALHDQNLALLVQTLDNGGTSSDGLAPGRLWKVRARKIVIAAGAHEKPLVFPGNDRPGVMLASAVRTYIDRYAVRPGTRALIVTNNDSALDTVAALLRADIGIAAIVDLRPATERTTAFCAEEEIDYLPSSAVTATHGRAGVGSVEVTSLGPARRAGRRIACDLVCMSGGWSPSVHLHAQRGGTLHYDERLAAFLPDDPSSPVPLAGAAAGVFSFVACIDQGRQAGEAAARACGFDVPPAPPPPTGPASEWLCVDASATVPVDLLLGAKQKSFVDLQTDVTVADLAQAEHEGFDSIEHLKRYTTLGMGTDQGKTSNANAVAIVAGLLGVPAAAIGHTTFRPPYVPVSLGTIAAQSTGEYLAPTRRTPFHEVSEEAGVTFVTAGAWLYPRYYGRGGETMDEAIGREVANTRRNVGIVDMSTLGKVDVQGRDALTFLERVYCNNLASLKVGRVRYSLMLREDGILLDDGTVSRIGEDHYFLTLTTANAGRVWLHLEKLRQAHWPELDVKLASLTDHWASLAVAGPAARTLLARLDPDVDVSNAAFPYASVRDGRLADLPARLFRVSFSGELGFEIAVPAGHARTLWTRLAAAGSDLGLMPYGLEALDVMRIEKGHVSVGTEIDGRTAPDDLGLGRMVSSTKDFIGRALLARPALSGPGRRQFVGLVPEDASTPLPVGAQIASGPWTGTPQRSIGHMTASIVSPTLGHPIGLAMIEDGRGRHGDLVWAVSPLAGASVRARIVSPAFHDPDGGLLRG